MSPNSLMRQIAGRLRTAIGLGFIVAILYYLVLHINNIEFNMSNIDIGWLIIASIIYFVFCFLSFSIFHYIMSAIKDIDISILDSAWIFFASLQGKYLPGKFGNLLLKYKFLRDRNIGLKNIMSVFFLEQGVALLAGVLVVGTRYLTRLLLPSWETGENLPIFIFYGVLLSTFFVYYMFYRYFSSINKYLKITLFYIVGWLLFTMAISLFIYSARDSLNIDYSGALELSLFYTASVVVGMLTFVSPAGLGVREAVFSYLISNRIADPSLLFVGIVIRSWTTVVEFSMLGLSYLAFKKFGSRMKLHT